MERTSLAYEQSQAYSLYQGSSWEAVQWFTYSCAPEMRQEGRRSCAVLLLFHAVGNETVGGIIGRYAHLYPVTDHNLDAVLLHAAGESASDGHIVVTLDFHNAAPKDPCYLSFQLN